MNTADMDMKRLVYGAALSDRAFRRNGCGTAMGNEVTT